MSDDNVKRRRYIILAGIVLVVAVTAAVLLWFRDEETPSTSATAPADGTASVAVPEVDVAAIVEPIEDGLSKDIEDLMDLPVVKAESAAPLSQPVHEVRKSLAETIAAESLEETAQNLANDDDMHFAVSSMSVISAAGMSTQGQIRITTRLARVRKLLEDGRKSPEQVIGVLRPLLEDALDWWEADRKAYYKRVSETVVIGGEDPAARACSHIVGATYILAELGHHDALPLFMRAYNQHEVDRKGRGLPAAAPPGMTLFAMHRLVSSHPVSMLSPEAQRLRQEYLVSAECIPDARTVTVTSWRAHYSEADPSVVVFEEERKMLRSQPTMTISIWPHCYADGKELSIEDGAVPDRTKALFDKLEAFVRAAYPDEEF